MKPALLRRLLATCDAKCPVALVTDLGTGQQSLVTGTADGAGIVHGDFGLEEPVLALVGLRLASGQSGVIEAGEETRLLVRPFLPAFRLVVVGAVHIAQALAPMAALAGWAVTVVDPRGRFATVARFPGVTLVPDWPQEALAGLGLDAQTAVVTLSHDPKLDDPALAAALSSPAFYIGALGSRRSHAARRQRLAALGFAAATLDRIHGPVGLALGAVTPQEIAVSILAQLTAVRRGAGDAGAADAGGGWRR